MNAQPSSIPLPPDRAPRPPARRRAPVTLRHRLAVASRVGAAVFGGYFLAHGAAAFLTLVLPFARVDRVIAASLLAFAVWCAAAIHVFAVRSAWRAWWTTVLAGTVLLGIAMLFDDAAARP